MTNIYNWSLIYIKLFFGLIYLGVVQKVLSGTL